MANEKQDEEYLETLLSSIIKGDEKENLSQDENEDSKDVDTEEDIEKLLEEFDEEAILESMKKLEEESVSSKGTESENSDSDENDFEQWLENELKKDDLSSDLDIDDVMMDEEFNDIDDIINSMYSEDEEMAADEEKNHGNRESGLGEGNSPDTERDYSRQDSFDMNDAYADLDNLTDIDSLINQDIESDKKGKKEKKKNKESFFKKLFSKKEKTDNLEEDLHEKEILSETGSTADDMEYFGMLDNRDRFEDFDNIDDVKEKKEKKKKKTKEKKKNATKNRKKKAVKAKKKKEKPLVKEEIIKISRSAMIFMATIIVAVILGVYFGSSVFSYNSNIKKASSYYVDKEYSKAYAILEGMDLKKSDEGFYNQIVNIMKVEKHVNDFYSYIEIKFYANALESLIKGVENYDANIGMSGELGTVEILNSILSEIDTALQNYYGMTVEEARTIIQINNKTEVSRIINEKSAGIRIGSN